MAEWRQHLDRFRGRVEEKLEEQRERLGMGSQRRARIEPYRGYGLPGHAWLKARVLRNAPVPRARERDSVWLNLAATLQRFESDEVPGARVRVRYPGGEQVLKADREGYVECWIDPHPPLDSASGWAEVEMELLEPVDGNEPFRTVAPVRIPSPAARFGVISDIDDTVVRTDVASRLRMARNVLLGNAHTRMPFPGVAPFYRALERGGDGRAHNPVFYVSSSPWNLYDALTELLELRRIPLGPVLLRDWGLPSSDPGPGGHMGHKSRHIGHILDTFPTLPFVLVGDSGQEDPEIYHRAVHDHPERILAVYIRNVSRAPERLEAIRALAAQVEKSGSTLILADDTVTAARHAAEHGWIDPACLAEIGAVADAEQQQPASSAVQRTNEDLSAGDR